MRLKWDFCLKILKSFKLWNFLEKQVGFWEKTWIFCQNRFIWQVWYTIRLKLCFYSRILKTFRFWILSENFLEFFKNAKVQGKLSASWNVLMLKGSQAFKFGFSGKKRYFLFKKKLASCEKMLTLPTFQ